MVEYKIKMEIIITTKKCSTAGGKNRRERKNKGKLRK
jgi:hypothetical protein